MSRNPRAAPRDQDDPPAVAGLTGTYREASPSAPLRAHFLCAWSSELAPGEGGDVAVLPDGCVDILWAGGQLSVVGPDVVAARPQLAPGARVLGLRFQPGAARGWLGVPLSELVGSRVGLDALWGDRRAGRLARRLQDAATPDAQMGALQQGLMLEARAQKEPSGHAAALFRGFAAASEPSGGRVGGWLELSERSLRRLSLDHFGYGPKMLERILRLQRFVGLLRQAPGAGLAALAAEARYADQAHLSREVQALCGMTPSQLRVQAGG